MFIPVITSFLTVCFNLVIGSTLIIVPLRLKEAGAGIFAITGTLSVWAVVCAVCAWLVGQILTERNARRLVQTGTALYFLCFLGLLLVPGVQMQYFWLLLLGIATAVYCAPFQVFLKTLENGKQAGLVRASALYSASWSFGMAVGPFLFSMLSAGENGMAWQLAYGINAVLMIPVFFLPVLAEKLTAHSNRTGTTEPPAPEDDFSNKPDLALWGWLLTVAAFAAVATTKSLLPEQKALVIQFNLCRNYAFFYAFLMMRRAAIVRTAPTGRAKIERPVPASAPARTYVTNETPATVIA